MGPNPTTRTDREAEQRGAEADGELGDVDVLLACRKEVTALVHCPIPNQTPSPPPRQRSSHSHSGLSQDIPLMASVSKRTSLPF